MYSTIVYLFESLLFLVYSFLYLNVVSLFNVSCVVDETLVNLCQIKNRWISKRKVKKNGWKNGRNMEKHLDISISLLLSLLVFHCIVGFISFRNCFSRSCRQSAFIPVSTTNDIRVF